jgi:hypothetical protein
MPARPAHPGPEADRRKASRPRLPRRLRECLLLVSIREHLESLESLVIRLRRSDSQEPGDVEEVRNGSKRTVVHRDC